MVCRERGLALITVLFFLAILMVLASILSDKVLRATREASCAASRDQALQAAAAGIEWARHQLATTYQATSGWTGYLARGGGGTGYPGSPAFTTQIGEVSVDIYLRDNPDGDADAGRDNDLKVFILSRARTATGGDVLVESLCGFIPDGTVYRQGGGDAQRSGQSVLDGPAIGGTITTFQLRE